MAAADFTPRVSTVAGRKALEARREPYWVPLDGVPHASLGYRKTGDRGTDLGTWICRQRGERDDGSMGYAFQALGALADHHAAAKAARSWLELRAKGVRDTDITVREVCSEFANAVETSRVNGRPPRKTHAKTLRLQYANWIDGDKLGRIALAKLTKAAVTDWRARLESTPDIHGKPRSGMSINREMSALRAALNWAKDVRELVPDDKAWRVPLQVIAGAARARTLYLDEDERRALLAEADIDIAALMKCLMLVPLRPGAAAGLNAGDFDKRLGVLTVHRDKTQAACGRQMVLPDETAKFFAAQCANKLPTAPMFTRADGARWTAREWGRATKAAVIKAFAEGSRMRKASMYTLRHCSITDLARSGVPLSTIAKWAGTSVAEIEKHYRKDIPGDAREGLAALSRFSS